MWLTVKIFVKVKLRAKEEKVKKIDDSHYEVSVKEPPIEGRANQAVIKAMADYLGVAKSKIEIVRGHLSREKLLEINQQSFTSNS